MFDKTFQHDSIRKYVAMFGTLFNDVWLNRGADGEVLESIKVPLTYMAKDKMLSRVFGDPNTDNKVAITLPRMSFEMEDMAYDGSRKFSKVGTVGRTANSGSHAFNPTPYDFSFSLYIYVKNSEDGTKIVEQILPYFTPDWTITANLIPGIQSKVDIPIILNSATKQDSFEGSFTERRAIIWTLNFTVKGYLFGPVIDRSRIETAITNIFTNWNVGATPDVTTTITEDNMDEF